MWLANLIRSLCGDREASSRGQVPGAGRPMLVSSTCVVIGERAGVLPAQGSSTTFVERLYEPATAANAGRNVVCKF